MSRATVASFVGPSELGGDEEKLVARLELTPGAYLVLAKGVCEGPEYMRARLVVTGFGIEHVGRDYVGVDQEPIQLAETTRTEDQAWEVNGGTFSLIAGATIELLGTAELFCTGSEVMNVSLATVTVDQIDVVGIPVPAPLPRPHGPR